MKIILKTTENYVPQSDDVVIRLNALLLKYVKEDKYTPVKELCIGFKKDYAMESKEVINMFREFADMLEQNAQT